MSELHKFLFDGLPVRGMVVRLTDAWQAILQRRAANTETGPAPAVHELLGEVTAAAVLMQSNVKFNGALVFQILAMARSKWPSPRCTATWPCGPRPQSMALWTVVLT